ncbi:MAG: antibiotic resistance protein VanZ [Stappia sp.]|jgi:VanZ family protein|uniref:antibiotic resistance protein VanZ n=1 Tax=Stappia sp. TaxID=1870903 RepID=UPI000C3D5893|nr:antibiotic resistance protein VanZ [Stappia sp.]MAA99450.1 antibiotic resistance protein VanZ [Stappia sp.]MBM20387.1 antibiotic resistance protein VanZ [Stappia sp.]|tara:strand:- start:170 stop:643 length:474 start_codon:yes stop_codon:yes gene_type:complete
MPSLATLIGLVRRAVERHYMDLSVSRVLPLVVLLAYGTLAGLVFNTGISHPWDKVQHLVFFGLLTLAIHAFFCCRLRISAGAAMAMGMLGEVVQGFMPNHEASLLDIVANSVGVSIVVVAILLVRSETRAALADAPCEAQPDTTLQARSDPSAPPSA